MSVRKVSGPRFVVTAARARYRLSPIEASYGRFNERSNPGERSACRATRAVTACCCRRSDAGHRWPITSSLGMLTKWRGSQQIEVGPLKDNPR
jgi:hypothetical protein